jgi:hypothetical protein
MSRLELVSFLDSGSNRGLLHATAVQQLHDDLIVTDTVVRHGAEHSTLESDGIVGLPHCSADRQQVA